MTKNLTAVSIHASRVGGDAAAVPIADEVRKFQSTPPVWEATTSVDNPEIFILFQSTPPVWEATSAPRRQ